MENCFLTNQAVSPAVPIIKQHSYITPSCDVLNHGLLKKCLYSDMPSYTSQSATPKIQDKIREMIKKSLVLIMDWKEKQLEFSQTHKMFLHCRRAEGVAGVQLMSDFALPLETQVWITWARSSDVGVGVDQEHIFTVMASVPAVQISSLAICANLKAGLQGCLDMTAKYFSHSSMLQSAWLTWPVLGSLRSLC